MYTPIHLDKMRNLRIGMKAISLVEKRLKKPISKLDMENLTMDDMATLIWAGLYHEDQNLSVDKVMDLIDDYSNIKTAMEAARDAMQQAFGVAEDNTEENESEKN